MMLTRPTLRVSPPARSRTPAREAQRIGGWFLIPIDLEPDANMARVVGDVVKSAKPGSTVEHFVTPKKTTELNQDYVELKAVGVDTATFTQFLEWEGGEAGSTADKRKVKRDVAGKTEVKIKTKQGGAVVKQMDVWVVWWNVTAQKVSGPSVSHAESGWTKSETTWSFTATPIPTDILDKTKDVPDMSGDPVPPPVPNHAAVHAFDGEPFGNASFKWDITRRWREHDLMPSIHPSDTAWPPSGSLYGTLPVADKIQKTCPTPGADYYPQDKVEGNDDGGNDTDPYAATSGGKLTDIDSPDNDFRDSAGAIGDTAEARSQFGEFVRAQIGTKWFRVSDFAEWRFHTKLKKVSEAILNQDLNGDGDKVDELWHDNGSVSDATNNGF
jgi:hypothetical protein